MQNPFGQIQQSHSFDAFFDDALKNPVQTAQNTLNNPFVQYTATSLGSKLGNNLIGLGEKYDTYINRIFSSQYRFYFDVDNNYVSKKIILTLAPYLYRGNWYDSETSTQQHMGLDSPRDNIYAPDYYVPLMSMVTFVLLRSLQYGITQQQIHPSQIVGTFWKCFIVTILEFLIVKITFCFMDSVKIYTFDLLSYLNYRYTTLCAFLILVLLFPGVIYYIGLVYILGCQAIFIYKTLQRYVVSQNSLGNNLFLKQELNFFGQNILLLLSLLQVFFSWALLYFGSEQRI